ncbi:MAG: hypothetical protein N3H30_01730 [Candidatus Micrarchaeota archaeon]|nr:hypothetical protein [Candidatus Micrarchaeota archaeon]
MALPGLAKKFKRVMSRLIGKKESIRDRVKDVPSSFLVEVARARQQDKEGFDALAKSSGYDPDDAAAAASELELYVSDMQVKGRNRSQIAQRSAAKKAVPVKGKKLAR